MDKKAFITGWFDGEKTNYFVSNYFFAIIMVILSVLFCIIGFYSNVTFLLNFGFVFGVAFLLVLVYLYDFENQFISKN